MPSREEKLIQKLIKLWSDESFSGSFTGVKNFQTHLLLQKNIRVSKTLIRKALTRLPEYSTTITRKYKFRRRQYSVSASRELGEIDYAFFKDISQGFIGFVCLIDAYNRFVFVEKIRSKGNKELEKKLKRLFRRSGPFNTGIPHQLLLIFFCCLCFLSYHSMLIMLLVELNVLE